MEIRRLTTVTLKAYFEDSNGDPYTGHNSDIRFVVDYDDGTAESAAVSTRELSGGWYGYDFTEADDKHGVWRAYDNAAAVKPFPGGIFTIVDLTVTSDDHTHATNQLEQIVFTETISSGIKEFKNVELDFYNFTKPVTVRVHKKVDGSTWRSTSYSWDTGQDDLFIIDDFYAHKDVKVTLQSGATEPEERNIPYNYFLRGH